MITVRDLVAHFKNKKNLQEKLEIKKNKLKEFNLTVDDILDLKINKKIKNFDEI